MNSEPKIHLQEKAILNVPLQKYEPDFTFIINGEEFKTNRIISDLLSPIICQGHHTDPTMNTFTINTQSKGHFSYILDLINFQTLTIPQNEVPFIREVLKILKNDSIEVFQFYPTITEDNVFKLLLDHNHEDCFDSIQVEKEIKFISSHFYKLYMDQKDSLLQLHPKIIEKVVSESSLHLTSEDQLLNFLNTLYSRSNDKNRRFYSKLYCNVLFSNVSCDSISDFLNVYDINDIDGETWSSISQRLLEEINQSKNQFNSSRYEKGELEGELFSPKGESVFDGIINYLHLIMKEVKVTSKSLFAGSSPSNVTLYENSTKRFQSKHNENEWICFDFLDKKVIPSHYQLRSACCDSNWAHPRSWVIEGSNDDVEWIQLYLQNDCPYLNGRSISHLFMLENRNESRSFRYIRMRYVGVNWCNGYCMAFDSFEIYGSLI